LTAAAGTETLVIRSMIAGDVVAVAAMARALADFHGEEGGVTARHLSEHCLGADRQGSVTLALIGDAPVGFALTYDRSNAGGRAAARHIDQVFVDADRRRRGVGEALIRAVARKALDQGFGRLTVGAAVGNAPANAFYRKLGFAPRAAGASQYSIRDTSLRALAARGD
jgi:GNAT superfamily N-acetyltransferase